MAYGKNLCFPTFDEWFIYSSGLYKFFKIHWWGCIYQISISCVEGQPMFHYNFKLYHSIFNYLSGQNRQKNIDLI